MPLPDPLVAPVNVIHVALLTAVHGQPVATVTPTLPVPPLAPMDRLCADSAGVQTGENENKLESVLAPDPPGPMAITLASNSTFGVGVAWSSGRKLTRMTPLTGVGLPRSIVSNAVDDPCAYSDSEYRCTSGVPSVAVAL